MELVIFVNVTFPLLSVVYLHVTSQCSPSLSTAELVPSVLQVTCKIRLSNGKKSLKVDDLVPQVETE